MTKAPARLLTGAALILAAALLGAATPWLRAIDRAVFGAVALQRGVSPEDWIETAQYVTRVGDLGMRAVILVVALGVFVWRGERRAGLVLLGTTLAAAALTDAAKAVYARPRPAIYPYIGEYANFSFPSGHASNTLAMLLMIGLLSRNRAFTALCVALALAVGASRVMLDVHWPSDIVGGWLLGAGVALVGWRFAGRRGTIADQSVPKVEPQAL